MAKSVFLVWSNPVDEASEKEYNAWYNDIHVPEVVEHVPGVTGAHRYRVVDLAGDAPVHRYLCVWETDTNDAASVAAGLNSAIQSGKVHMTSAIDTTANPPSVQWFEAVED